MAYSYPRLEAKRGFGFAHEISVKGSQPRELVANVDGSKENWPLAQLFAGSPELLAACLAAKKTLEMMNEEFEWLPDEQLQLDAALNECGMAIAHADWHSQATEALRMTVEEELARR